MESRTSLRRYVVRVTVSGGQARVTLPKELAVRHRLLTENGEAGEAIYVAVTSTGLGRIELTPLKMEEFTEDA